MIRKDTITAKDKRRKAGLWLAALFGLTAMLLSLAGCSRDLYSLHGKPPELVTEPKAPPPVGTIWPGETSVNSLFSDKKARYVNDIVTITVAESATGANNATTNTSRAASTTAGLAGITQTDNSHTLMGKYELGGSQTNSLKGDGATSRNSNLTGTITARVVRVLDNGNLFIEGRRQLTVNAEDQYLIITGVIRPEDINSANVISSSYIADAKIYYTGKGVVDDKQRPGWLTRVLDWVWPF